WLTNRSDRFCTVVVQLTVLLLKSGSTQSNMAMAQPIADAEFVITEPSTTPPFTAACRTTVDALPGDRGPIVTVRLFPEPPQTPPFVALQETKVTELGKLSVRVIAWATASPRLVTVSP